jgi:hypothetical protein
VRNPADDLKWLYQIRDDVKSVVADVRDLQQQRTTYLQDATVSSYISGAFCEVTFASGETANLGRLSTYTTPVVGDAVVVLISPFRSVVLGKPA